MTDFSEIENELKKLRPAQPSHELLVRIEQTLADPEISERKIIRPGQPRKHTGAATSLGGVFLSTLNVPPYNASREDR